MNLVLQRLPRDEQTVISSVDSVYQKRRQALVTSVTPSFCGNLDGPNLFGTAQDFRCFGDFSLEKAYIAVPTVKAVIPPRIISVTLKMSTTTFRRAQPGARRSLVSRR
jgi:hypothetical protein